MKRPILVITIGYILGIVWGLYCKCSIALLYGIILIIYISVKLIYKPKKKLKLFSIKRYLRYFKIFIKFNIIITIIISSFISNLIIKNQNIKYHSLYKNVESTHIEGIIVSNFKKDENIYTYKLKVNKLNNDLKFKNTYLIVKIKNNDKLKYGDKVEIYGEYIEPSGQRNYKGFNYKEYLKTQKIYGTINANKVKIIENNCLNPVLMFSNSIYLHINNKMEKILPNEECNLVLGIMLGNTDNLDENIKEQFTDGNMAHILAVSGMHVTYINMQLTVLLKPLLGKRKSKIVIMFLLILYMLITGCSPSIMRATIMNLLIISAELFYRKNDTWNSIFISLFIILVYNPFLITNVSTLISYAGTIGIITFNKTILYLLKKIKIRNKKYKYVVKKKFAKIIKYIRETLAITISVQISIVPIIATIFNKVGVAFLVTNMLLTIIIGPIISLSLFLILLSFISLEIAKLLSYFLIPFLKILIGISKLGASMPLSKLYVATPSILRNCYLLCIYNLSKFYF